ncbi:MAG TPA: methylmalonyl Co-A mutase-associated GTPase MeaB [Cyclobacteriaceae bacterium]|nr:methylmalonyl Co-A mutase-associated GTPase MeaB [Cyclobacteriaceae bacterium]
MKQRLSTDEYVRGVTAGDRVILAKAISLAESSLPEDQKQAAALLAALNPVHTAIRIGITGVPGVGKSTFIESFGKHVTSLAKKIAVLTIDPSSQLTKGSILGDKTRMEELSKNPRAFIRPSPSGNTLGGTTGRTRECILLCEAAGYDVILVETVGVGQSETAVNNLVDFFLLLMLAGAGDELQGIKKGIMEMADAIVITKADGDNVKRAKEAQADYQHALNLFPAHASGWKTKVLTCSALKHTGIKEIWESIVGFKDHTVRSGYFEQQRKAQRVTAFRESFDRLLKNDLNQSPGIQKKSATLEKEVADQKISAQQAAQQLLDLYHQAIKKA